MKAVVLLSGGLDSSVNLYEALAQGYQIVKVLSFNYGQKAFDSEILAAKRICEQLKLDHLVIDLTWLKAIGTSSLTSDSQIPEAEALDIQSLEVSKKSAKSVWVPNRNGIFLNIAAAFAEGLMADFIIPGFNLEEAQTFADNSKDFLSVSNHAFSYSTQTSVKVKCFTIDMNKSEILALALKRGVDLSQLWPCYRSGDKWCANCESCLRFKRACEKQNMNYEKLRGSNEI